MRWVGVLCDVSHLVGFYQKKPCVQAWLVYAGGGICHAVRVGFYQKKPCVQARTVTVTLGVGLGLGRMHGRIVKHEVEGVERTSGSG